MRLLRFLIPVRAGHGRQQCPGPVRPAGRLGILPHALCLAAGLRGNLRTPLPRLGDQSFGLSSGSLLSDLDALPVMIAGEARYGRFAVVGDFFYPALAQDLNTRNLLWQGGHSRVTSSVGTMLGMFRVLEEPQQSSIWAPVPASGISRTKVSLNPGLEAGGRSGKLR